MSARSFEAFLTRIYVDADARAHFKANPRAEAQRAGLSEEECAAVENLDWMGLEMAARSFAHKRRSKLKRNRTGSFRDRLRHFLAILSNRIRSHHQNNKRLDRPGVRRDAESD
jgi:hypothetical protein